MYYYGGYQGYGCGAPYGGGYGGGYGTGYGAAIILVLFILLVIIIGARVYNNNWLKVSLWNFFFLILKL